jgi:hypothetical protein
MSTTIATDGDWVKASERTSLDGPNPLIEQGEETKEPINIANAFPSCC